MGRPEKPVDPSRGSVAAFARELRRLREQAGSPTYRELARRARFSPSVLSSAANGHRLPSLHVVLAFVAACGGDQEVWRHRWLQAWSSTDVPPATPLPATPPVPAPDRYRMPLPAALPLRPRGFATRWETLRQLASGPLNPPLLVTGPFGVGKSELALRFAHQVAGTMDGQLYADLAPHPAGQSGAQAVLDGLLAAVGIPFDRLPGSTDQRAGLYRSLLSERRLVVLLDNVQDERQVRPLLPECQQSLTIIVSRRPLLGLRDVRRLRLGVLSRAESLEMLEATMPASLLADRADRDALAEICGDLPLALDIAVRKLAARPEVQLPGLLRKLAGPSARLDWLQIGDLSVRESLASAYRQLSAPARTLLHLLAWPRGSDANWRVGGEVTEELVEAGMLRRGGPEEIRIDPFAHTYVLAQEQPDRPDLA